MFSLKSKKAVVTGGGSGIGQAIAVQLAANGAEVHILEITEQSGQQTLEKIRSYGGNATVYACDVSKQKDVLEVFAQIGAINILVNNAGIAHIGKADTTSEDDFDRIYNVNIKGVYNCLFAAIPQIRKSGSGVIINMASIAALVGIPDRFAYSTAKGAVKAMTMSVAKDYINS